MIRMSFIPSRCDIWAAGMCLWNMLAGEPAFDGAFTELILQRILTTTIVLPYSITKRTSSPCQQLLMQLLHRRPELRPTASEAARHAWVVSLGTYHETVTIPLADEANKDDPFVASVWNRLGKSMPESMATAPVSLPPFIKASDTTSHNVEIKVNCLRDATYANLTQTFPSTIGMFVLYSKTSQYDQAPISQQAPDFYKNNPFANASFWLANDVPAGYSSDLFNANSSSGEYIEISGDEVAELTEDDWHRETDF